MRRRPTVGAWPASRASKAAVKARTKTSVGCAPETPIARSKTKNGTPVRPRAMPVCRSVSTSAAIGIAREDGLGVRLRDADLGGQSDQRGRVVEDLAFDELPAQQPFLDRRSLALARGEVGDAVGIERVDDRVALEVVREAFGRGEFDDPLVHDVDVGDGPARPLGQVLVVASPLPGRLLGVQLEAAPDDLDPTLGVQRLERALEPTLADVAPRTDHVGPDLDDDPFRLSARLVSLFTQRHYHEFGGWRISHGSDGYPSRPTRRGLAGCAARTTSTVSGMLPDVVAAEVLT